MAKRRKNRKRRKWLFVAIACVLVVGPALGAVVYLNQIEPPPPLLPPPDIPVLLIPSWARGPSKAKVCVYEISRSWCQDCQGRALEHCLRQQERETVAVGVDDGIFTVSSMAAEARFVAGGNRADVAIEPVVLRCSKPPAPPEKPTCDLDSYKKEQIKVSNILTDTAKGGGYLECRGKWVKYAKNVSKYNEQLKEKETRLHQEIAQFKQTLRARTVELYQTLSADPEYINWTHLLRGFASASAACQRFWRDGDLPANKFCDVSFYSDFDPDYRDQGVLKKPKNFEAQIKGIDLRGVRFNAYVIPHSTTEIGTKLAEVRQWLTAMGAEIGAVEIFEYDF